MDLFDDLKHTGLSPLIKWAGGKEKELAFIFPNAPHKFDHYYEPFVGGGAVFAAISAKRYFVNDRSEELIAFYRSIQEKDACFFYWLEAITSAWSLMLAFVDTHRELCHSYVAYREERLSDTKIQEHVSLFLERYKQELNRVLDLVFKWKRELYVQELKRNLLRKIARMKQLEHQKGLMPIGDIYDNIETAFMGAVYLYMRHLYNDRALMGSEPGLHTALFVFIRNYAYSGMFRYSSKGAFNVPYGGIGYNHKSLRKKMEYYRSEALRSHLDKTEIYNEDFELFLQNNPPGTNDFVFLDPPYDSEFSTYAQNIFSQDDQRRLANYLINECQAKWMMIIKYTPFIWSLYSDAGLTIRTFDKRYCVSFMNRNDQKAEHLIIMNY